MITVYLDQNKWIELAKAYHRRDSGLRSQAALAFVQETIRNETHVYPLSAVHYMETNRVREPGRRARLGSAMWALAGGWTIALGRELLVHEIELALARRFPGVSPAQFSTLGHGVAFAFGQPRREFRVPQRAHKLHTQEYIDAKLSVAYERFERSCLTGEGPDGKMMPPGPSGEHGVNFVKHLAGLPDRFSPLARKQWDDGLHAVSMLDILEPLTHTLERHALALDSLLALGKAELLAFIDDLPSRRVDIHLHRQFLKNPSLRPKPNDLQDWAALGPASAHCDIVVCEKHFANLLLREGFQPRARVLTDLAELPSATESAA